MLTYESDGAETSGVEAADQRLDAVPGPVVVQCLVRGDRDVEGGEVLLDLKTRSQTKTVWRRLWLACSVPSERVAAVARQSPPRLRPRWCLGPAPAGVKGEKRGGRWR